MIKDPGKLRLWRIAELLFKETDEHNMLSAAQIDRILSERYSLESNPRTIHDDIRFLTDVGMSIEIIHSTQNRYYVSHRLFELPELQLLIDAVESSRFVTEKKSRILTDKLLTLTSIGGAEQLRGYYVADPDRKPENEQIYYIADTVSQAIAKQRKIRFKYYRYDAYKNKQLKHNGEAYVFSPYSLVWNGDFYYMIGWCDTHGGIGSYRLERIYSTPEILEDAAVPAPEDFSVTDYVGSMFRMYNTARETVTLVCANDLMDAMIDRFGTSVNLVENRETEFVISVDVAVNHVFFSWVFGFGGRVRILSPVSVCETYRRMVEEAADMLKRNEGNGDGK